MASWTGYPMENSVLYLSPCHWTATKHRIEPLIHIYLYLHLLCVCFCVCLVHMRRSEDILEELVLFFAMCV